MTEDWATTRTLPLFAVFKETGVKNDGMAETNLLSLSYGRIVPKSIETVGGLLPASFETYQIVNPGQVVLRLTDMQNDQKSLRSGLVRERGIITSAYCALQSRGWGSEWDRYFDYFFHSLDVSKRLYALGGGVRQSLKYADIKHVDVAIPSVDMRDKIVQFLDVETVKIDHLIAKQRELLSLLVDRETARRNRLLHSVTGPKFRLRWLLTPSRERATGDEEVLSVYRDYGVIQKNSRTDNFNKTPEDVSNYLVVHPGDLVVNKMKAWQGSLGVSEFHGIVSGDYEVLRPSSDDVDLSFLHYLLRSRRMVNQYALRSKGIRPSQWRLYWQELSEIEIPVPPLAEQREIAELIDETKANRTALSPCERMIELLQERRAALITAAVTGQVEV